ncbi:MAG: DNA translocase FtsK, partial [bacterium]
TKPKKKKNDGGSGFGRLALREGLGIACVLAGCLSVAALGAGGQAAALRGVNDAYFYFLGVGAWAVPAVFFALGAWFFMPDRRLLAGLVHLGALTLFAASLYHLFRAPADADFCTQGAMLRMGGGLAGGLVSCGLAGALGKGGAALVLGAAALVYVQAAIRFSYVEVYRRVRPALAGSASRASRASRAALSAAASLAGRARKSLRARAKAAAAVPAGAQSGPVETPVPPAGQDVEIPVEYAARETAEQEESSVTAGAVGGDAAAPGVAVRPVTMPAELERGRRRWKLPSPDDWLDPDESASEPPGEDATRKKLDSTLESFQVPAKIVNVVRGASFTRFEIELQPGTKVSQLISLGNDIALSLAADARTIRIEAPIPGKSAVGIEVPNEVRAIVPLRRIFTSEAFSNGKGAISFCLGEDIGGAPVCADLTRMPHLLVAGSTNSGKSVCLNSIITSIIAKRCPSEVRFIMVDVKRVELTPFNGVPHLLTPVILETAVAAGAMRWITAEMDRRYKAFAEMGVRNIDAFNHMQENPDDRMYRIVLIVDELADLMMVSSPNQYVETYICRITQLARATGIHVILATQRPDTRVITGTIKNNIPSRISFAVASQIDSRTILDHKGAESLLGRGDMLFMPMDSNRAVRLQGAYVKDKELKRLVNFWKKQAPSMEYPLKFEIEESHAADGAPQGFETEDEEIYRKAVEIVVSSNQVSISMLQRKLRIGYNRSARLVELMEERGVVGPYDGVKPREVLITPAALERGEF